jgi:hypothetical protein
VTPGTLDDQYLYWLYSLVADVRTRKGPRTYWNLFRKLFKTEFTWFVPHDDNRAEDGRELRAEWASLQDVHVDPNWAELGCSFLEMLIGLARRLEFMTDQDVVFWFWHLIGNLGLLGHNDRCRFMDEDVEARTSAVIWRTYDRHGEGGLFPLRNTQIDQRKVELWYQLNSYVIENER